MLAAPLPGRWAKGSGNREGGSSGGGCKNPFLLHLLSPILPFAPAARLSEGLLPTDDVKRFSHCASSNFGRRNTRSPFNSCGGPLPKAPDCSQPVLFCAFFNSGNRD